MKIDFDKDDAVDFAAAQQGLEQFKSAMRSIERRHMAKARAEYPGKEAGAYLAISTSAYGFYGDGVSLHERVSRTAARSFDNFTDFLLGGPQPRGGGGGRGG